LRSYRSSTRRQNPCRPREASILKVLLIGCTSVGLLLGAFVLAGDRLELWEPVEAPSLPLTQKRGLVAPRAGLAETDGRELSGHADEAGQPPGPPLRARTAFVFAALAAAVGLLVFAARQLARIVRDIRWPRVAAVPAWRRAQARTPSHPTAPVIAADMTVRRSFGSLTDIGIFRLGVSRDDLGVVAFYALVIVLSAVVGYLVVALSGAAG
jgi:hypothetical protein